MELASRNAGLALARTWHHKNQHSGKCGKEFWSRRFPFVVDASPYGKNQTHRYERRKAKEIVRQELDRLGLVA